MRNPTRIHCMILLAALAPVLVLPGLPTQVLAQPVGVAKNPKKEPNVPELFDRAQAAFKAGDMRGAYDAYLAAWRIQESYDIAGNLGTVEMKLGKFHDAATHFSYALRSFPPTGLPEQKKRLERSLAEARARVGVLRVAVSQPNAAILLDGSRLGTSPLEGEVFVEAGPHTLEAKLAGYKDARREIVANVGSAYAVELVLVAVPSDAAAGSELRRDDSGPELPDPPPLSDLEGGRQAGVWIGGFTLSALAFAGGITLLVVSNSLRADADALRAELAPSGCFYSQGSKAAACADLKSTIDARNITGNLGVGAMVAGGAVAAGTLTYLLWPRRSTPRAGARVTALPTGSTTSGGLVVTGLW